MGYLIKADVINCINKSKEKDIDILCFNDNRLKDIVEQCYFSIRQEIDKIVEYKDYQEVIYERTGL